MSKRSDPADRPLGDVLEFMRTLWALDHGLQLRSKRMERQLGITGPQRLVLRIVGRFPDISAGDLAAVLHIHPSTLSGVLRRLEDRGALKRRPDPADARRALLRLSAQGQKLNKVRSATVETTVQRVLRKVSPAQAKAAQQLLGLLAEELGREV
jgi:MarR family transcriptional regulator, organic hydroperoxide resistance regulator